jgi:hypothetical protein
MVTIKRQIMSNITLTVNINADVLRWLDKHRTKQSRAAFIVSMIRKSMQDTELSLDNTITTEDKDGRQLQEFSLPVSHNVSAKEN